MQRKFLSWNINGIRAIEKKGFLPWFLAQKPDILALQETKAAPAQVPPALADVAGYFSYFSEPLRKGYSGVGVYTKEQPLRVDFSMGVKEFDDEGRLILLEYPGFYFINCYFPNGGQGDERIAYKLRFYAKFLEICQKLSAQKPLITCGDVNTAHREIDLARPKANENNTGFLPRERAWLDKFFANGLVDIFRRLHLGEAGQYTWWDYKTGARARNVGWRIDYFMLDASAARKTTAAYILKDVLGSDHAPIGIDINI